MKVQPCSDLGRDYYKTDNSFEGRKPLGLPEDFSEVTVPNHCKFTTERLPKDAIQCTGDLLPLHILAALLAHRGSQGRLLVYPSTAFQAW